MEIADRARSLRRPRTWLVPSRLRLSRLPYVLVAAVTGFVGVVQLTLVQGDLFNSYPFLFSDSFDWIMQGAYLRALFGGELLPPLRVLRDPGFLVLSVLDQIAGGNGLIILPALTAANAAGAVFLVRSLALLTPDWRLQTLGVGIYLLHPALASLRFFVMADQLAVAFMAGSFFYMMRYLQQCRDGDYLKSALLGSAAFLTQKYGVLPFLIGLGLSGLDWLRGPRERRHLAVLAVGAAVALGPERLFIFALR